MKINLGMKKREKRTTTKYFKNLDKAKSTQVIGAC